MLPLKIAVLWHQHQPYYKMEGEFILPWVRLHGVKDYYDLPYMLHEFPKIKQTFNLVPSMIIQLDEYISGHTKDKVQKLTEIPADELNDRQKKEILRLFFLCNEERMIKPYPRFWELFGIANNSKDAIHVFNNQDWIDVQVWYNLTWFGRYSRKRPEVKMLFDKGRGFTEAEKLKVLELHNEVLGSILPQMKKLMDSGQIEVAVSPMYHPILPLLCDSASAAEAIPDVQLPNHKFSFPQDAQAQIEDAVRFYTDKFAELPKGMWPSEGAVSDKTLELIANSGIKWVATDEEILTKTISENYFNGNYSDTEKYFPRTYKSASGDISILFRDHFLSDRIGFVYSNWNHIDAANDFMGHLRNIRNKIVNSDGEEALKKAVVPIVLDGENCWEFYHENGVPFLKELYRQLSESNDIETVTCTEAIGKTNYNFVEPINHIRAGSWINADFKIWIGHEDHRKAWSMLSKARKEIDKAKSKLPEKQFSEAMQNIYIAEGSDWFWWYGNEHEAPNKPDFDILFRWFIRRAYQSIGMQPPEDTKYIIGKYSPIERSKSQAGTISPTINGKYENVSEWQNAGIFDARGEMSTMHQVGGKISRVLFGCNSDDIFIRIEFEDQIREGDSIEIIFSGSVVSIICNANGISIKNINDFPRNYIFGFDEVMEIKLGRNLLDVAYNSKEDAKTPNKFHLRAIFGGNLSRYPNNGEIEIDSN